MESFVSHVNSHLRQRQENERLKTIIARIDSYEPVVSWEDLLFRARFFVLSFLLILSNFLSTEKLTHKKSWAILKNFNSWIIKFTVIQKNPIWHMAIWQSWCYGQFKCSKIEVLQNCSAFFMSVSLVRGKSQRIEMKFKTNKSSPS